MHPFGLGPTTNTRVAGLTQPAAWEGASSPIADEPNPSPVQSCQQNDSRSGSSRELRDVLFTSVAAQADQTSPFNRHRKQRDSPIHRARLLSLLTP